MTKILRTGAAARWRARYKLALAAGIAVVAAAGATVASGATTSSGPGCKGPELTGTATPSLALSSPQQMTVTETLTGNCPGLSASHIVLYLTSPEGWTVTPSGAQRVPDLQPGRSDTATWHVQVPAGEYGSGLDAQAIYDVGPHSTDSTVATVAATVAYPSVPPAFGNVGITDDSDTAPGNIDGSGYSLSAQALAAAGVTPGSTVTAGGLSFTWPAAAAGQPDNIVASGQAIVMNGAGPSLGFLVTGTYGPASGTGTILYTDGTSQSYTLTAPDWYSGPATGSSVAISTAHRNAPGNVQDDHAVQVYVAAVPLQAGKTVEAVILPDVSPSTPVSGAPALHIFAMTIG